jgi:tryptophan synthase alpha subunit
LDAAVAAPIVIRDYLMERGIKYTVQLIADCPATTLIIDDTPDDRLDSVVWFARKHLLAAGLVLADSSGDSTVV